MRSLFTDGEYFAYLDDLRGKGRANWVMAPTALMSEFPCLRAEEAKAICADWRANRHAANDASTAPKTRQRSRPSIFEQRTSART